MSQPNPDDVDIVPASVMPSLSVARSVTASFAPSYVPVAVFVGGTSGIGRAMAENLARYTKGNAHIILVGRNRNAAESIIHSFPKPNSVETSHEFIECDATSMKNVDGVTKNLLARLGKINFLILSPGFLSAAGRDETEEGMDKRLALNYYARWKFIRDLMPLMSAAKSKSG
jgi:NAD(P)-dependent dehydrogenase (short-subunit alcohol dehydrogenase family)